MEEERDKNQSKFEFVFFWNNLLFRKTADPESDIENEDENEELPLAAQPKRHMGNFDLRVFSEVMDVWFFYLYTPMCTINFLGYR